MLYSRLTRWIAAIGVLGLLAIASMTMVDVMMRWVFNAPIDGVVEITRLLVAISAASFFPIALAHRHHITIRFLGNALGGRGRNHLEAFSACTTLAFFGFLFWQLILYTSELYDGGETTWILGWRIAPWWAVATAMFVFCIPVQAAVLFTHLVGNRDSKHKRSPDDQRDLVTTDDGE